MIISDSPAARAAVAARRLLAHGMPEHGTPDAVAAGAEQVFAHLYRNLSQWIGPTGCHVLFARALAISAPQHPVLTGVQHQQQGAPYLDRLAENAREYGSQATAEGSTALLATIITMLAGLIGESIAMSLLDEMPTRTTDVTPATTSGTAPGLPKHIGDREVAS